ncbi:hypothetical protein C4573_06750 [Candidatus Woesearchaeota archaeon]|nr:MAG: hypothetical protein C4573_06750 [Candidatus Woesearchaeota archaeon]
MKLKTRIGLALAATAAIAFSGCSQRQQEQIGDYEYPDRIYLIERAMNYSQFNDTCMSIENTFAQYEGIPVTDKVNLKGFHESFHTADGGYVTKLGSQSFLFDAQKKLIAGHAHNIVKSPEYGLITILGPCVSDATPDLKEITAIVDLYKLREATGKASDVTFITAEDIQNLGITHENSMLIAMDILNERLTLRSEGVYLNGVQNVDTF